MSLPGRDIRDPKLAVIHDRLHLYVLANDSNLALPDDTLVATSEDGSRWSAFEPTGPAGFLLWRPRTLDGHTWYVPAFGAREGTALLLRSSDGRRWERVGEIYGGRDASETDIVFLPDGRLLATVRLERVEDLWRGGRSSGTFIAHADPPYDGFVGQRIGSERLDGPALFVHEGVALALGRRQPGTHGGLTGLGGLLSRKRTALYRVEPDGLVHLADLPSAGDTSYPAVVEDGDEWIVSYYSSDPERDLPWIVGMLRPTRIYLARIRPSELLDGSLQDGSR